MLSIGKRVSAVYSGKATLWNKTQSRQETNRNKTLHEKRKKTDLIFNGLILLKLRHDKKYSQGSLGVEGAVGV